MSEAGNFVREKERAAWLAGWRAGREAAAHHVETQLNAEGWYRVADRKDWADYIASRLRALPAPPGDGA